MSADHPWWNSNYNLRYQLFVPASSFAEDTHVMMRMDIDNATQDATFDVSGKVRQDFEDIEVLYYNESNGTWTVLPSKTTLAVDDDTGLVYTNIQFVRASGILGQSVNYYIYSANPNLNGATHRRPDFRRNTYTRRPGYPNIIYDDSNNRVSSVPLTPEDYYRGIDNQGLKQIATPETSTRFTVSRPKQDWVNGLSDVQGARASFVFSGETLILVYEAGPDRGMLDINSSKADWHASTRIDTYSPQYTYKAVTLTYPATLNVESTTEFYVSGDKRPSSSGYNIRLDAILYNYFDEAILVAEELNSSTNRITRYMVGK